jgi:hypothetical protein
MADDDWRVEWELLDDAGWPSLRSRLREHEAAGEARERLGDRVAISVDAGRLFAYADTRERADEAARVISELLAGEGVDAGPPALLRWHAEEERWVDADVPLPQTAAEHGAERDRLRAEQRAESEQLGAVEWEVRVGLAEHADAVALAERLEAEGLQVLRRSRFVLAGAPSQADAEALADRLRGEAPAGASVEVEGSESVIWGQMHPFALFGGLGG